ncbi:cysteine-rich CWC family protein [Hydrogenophaga soli]|nr:cysteine-rich CWC family protein [Burkholderiaceae bacterium]
MSAQPSAPPDLDPSRCPLCGGPNGCALCPGEPRARGEGSPPCWCTQAHFPASLLAQVPAHAQRKACICARCVAAHPHP